MKEILKNHLQHIASSHNEYFDEGMVKYILNNIEQSSLNEKFIINGGNYNFETNLWGFIAYHNYQFKEYNIEDNTSNVLLNKNVPNPERALEKLQEYNEKIKSKYDIVQKWKDLLLERFPSMNIEQDLSDNPIYEVCGKHNKIDDRKVNLNGLIAIIDLPKYYDLQEKSPQMYSLNKADKRLIVDDLLKENQKYYLYYNTQADCIIFIAEMIRDCLGKNAPSEKLNKLFESKNTKFIIEKTPTYILQEIFSEKYLKEIIKKAHVNEVLKTNPHMLSSILPLAPAEKWIEIAGGKSKNFLGFCNVFLYKLTNNKVDEVIEKLQNYRNADNKQSVRIGLENEKVSNTKAGEMEKRLTYFAQYLKDNPLSNNDKHTWYTMICLCGNKELYKKSREIIDLPDGSNQQEFLYDRMFTRVYKKSYRNEDIQTWKEVEGEYLKEKLVKDLEKDLDNNKNAGKKFKI